MLAWQEGHGRRPGALVGQQGNFYTVLADAPVTPAFVTVDYGRAVLVAEAFSSLLLVQDREYLGILEGERAALLGGSAQLRRQIDWLRRGPAIGVDTSQALKEAMTERSHLWRCARRLEEIIAAWETLFFSLPRRRAWWIPKVEPLLPTHLAPNVRAKTIRLDGRSVSLTEIEGAFEDPALQIVLRQDRAALGDVFPLILGVDPGEHTGFALMSGTKVLWLHTAYGPRATWDTLAYLTREYHLGPPDGIPFRIACERFLGFQFLNRERLTSMESEAATRLFAELLGIPLTRQTSSQIAIYSRKRLLALTGLRAKDIRTQHEADAIAHCLYATGVFTPKGGATE